MKREKQRIGVKEMTKLEVRKGSLIPTNQSYGRGGGFHRGNQLGGGEGEKEAVSPKTLTGRAKEEDGLRMEPITIKRGES